MTPNEKNIVKSLIAVAWADGKWAEAEEGMIDGLLWAFGADDNDETELREYAKKKRTLADDAPIDELTAEDRELLLAHAALLTHADGKQTKAEKKILDGLIERLDMDATRSKEIVKDARTRAKKLAERL